jgi:hypothetical protein
VKSPVVKERWTNQVVSNNWAVTALRYSICRCPVCGA